MKPTDLPRGQLMPSLQAVPFLGLTGAAHISLNRRQREALAGISERIVVPAKTLVYRQSDPAQFVFAISEGSVKSFRELPSGKREMAAFLFSNDLFGLAQDGLYLNSVETMVRSTIYRMPIADLVSLLKRDGEIQFNFLVKVTHELREAQKRNVLLQRRDASGRLAMFIVLMNRRVARTSIREPGVALPMTRSDIAAFLGLSMESVGRATAQLVKRGLVEFDGPRVARIIDPIGLRKLIAAGGRRGDVV